ncbi:expressed unknown protein [Seminavis robusta]|uniref:Peptidase M12B domain-containing protein n=1 Tax=Seminavis robusta TaxID=568900 RepID=A0A9N8DEJ6_9STRA|nr:expressed unknown protein [Seminavis robusta]|eukprot:Sro57_g033160.1 n/a (558) ;mRNA; f:20319-22173
MVMYWNIKFPIAVGALCNGLISRGVEAQQVRRPEWVGIPDDVMKEFKLHNQLREGFDAPCQRVSKDDEFAIDNEILSFRDDDLQRLDDIFADGAEYYLDGVKQNALPPTAIYKSKDSPNVLVTKDGHGQLERASKVDPATGESVFLVPLELESKFFVEVGPTDVDERKLRKFRYGEAEVVDSGEAVRKRLLRSTKLAIEEQIPVGERHLQTTCQAYDVIEVAVVYESRFCNFFGGPSSSNNIVQTIIAETSVKYQQFCKKVSMSYIEGHCNSATDPYFSMFSGSVCGDSGSLLTQFRNYWRAERQGIPRDTAHLFHAFTHPASTIGCAYIGALCSSQFGYAVNEITFGRNDNQNLWAVLVAHELGHNAGANHDCCGFIMNGGICSSCQTFSSQSVGEMNNFIGSVTCIDPEANTATPTIGSPEAPTSVPSVVPTVATGEPSGRPSMLPSVAPSLEPSMKPSEGPSMMPTESSENPSSSPTAAPTAPIDFQPTAVPTNADVPTSAPATPSPRNPLPCPTSPAPPTNPPMDGTCAARFQYCDQIPCCPGWQCFYGIVCF